MNAGWRGFPSRQWIGQTDCHPKNLFVLKWPPKQMASSSRANQKSGFSLYAWVLPCMISPHPLKRQPNLVSMTSGETIESRPRDMAPQVLFMIRASWSRHPEETRVETRGNPRVCWFFFRGSHHSRVETVATFVGVSGGISSIPRVEAVTFWLLEGNRIRNQLLNGGAA